MRKAELIHSMFTENTGRHFLDSGGAYGRNWERNQGVTVETMLKSDTAKADIYDGKLEGVTVNSFHFIHEQTELDELCDEYNSLPCDDWNSDYCGTSEDQKEWLDSRGFEFSYSFNTYNDPDNYPLSQVLQWTMLTREGDFGTEFYVLMQVHGGCDVRGGYTDAKLFKLENEYCYDGGYMTCGSINGGDDTRSFCMYGYDVEWFDIDTGDEIEPPTDLKEVAVEAYYGC